ncbi:MAG: protein translocase subunit SecD [Vampirovibrionales bacterium]|nr:protein translocase subunit SecD [Vampirovibrionales bacterium]
MSFTMSPLQRARTFLMVIVLMIVASALYVANHPPRLGLDLQGGTRLTLEAQPSELVPAITKPVMDSLYTVIERRVNGLGVGEAIVQRSGEKRLIVEIPGVQNPDEAKAMLGKTGSLTFKRLATDGRSWVESGISGKDLSKADVATSATGDWLIQFELNGAGSQKFADLTSQMAANHEPLGIFFDDKLISSPGVREAILQGSGVIEGQFKYEEAKNLVDILNAGALPVSVDMVEETTVGPLLGQSSVRQSLIAGGCGLLVVLVFMGVMYRGQGLIADLALLVYTLLTFSAFNLVGVTFTLAGIAGFILSIGMAVDANILIFERTKEEVKSGRSLWTAIDLGFDRAFPSIFDSNMTTLLTCILLWVLGTGAVKGFAVTLAIGVAISMFSAIVVTKTFLHVINGPGASGSSGSGGSKGNFQEALASPAARLGLQPGDVN